MLTTSVFPPNVYSSLGLPSAGAAPPPPGTVTCGEDNGTARHAAWNGARPHARGCARVCRLRPRSGAASQAHTATRGPSRVALARGGGEPHWSPDRRRHCGVGAHANSLRRHLAPQAIRRPRELGAAPRPFGPASRSAGHLRPAAPTQARSRPAPPPPPSTARSPPGGAERPSEGAWPQSSTRARALSLTATCRDT